MDDAGRASAPAAVTVSATSAPALPPPSATTAAADTSSPDPSALYGEGMWQQMAMNSGATMQPGPYPERPGEPDCTYYLRTGLCRFGMSCRFNHPPDRNLAIASARMKGEYPERVGQPECQAGAAAEPRVAAALQPTRQRSQARERRLGRRRSKNRRGSGDAAATGVELWEHGAPAGAGAALRLARRAPVNEGGALLELDLSVPSSIGRARARLSLAGARLGRARTRLSLAEAPQVLHLKASPQPPPPHV